MFIRCIGRYLATTHSSTSIHDSLVQYATSQFYDKVSLNFGTRTGIRTLSALTAGARNLRLIESNGRSGFYGYCCVFFHQVLILACFRPFK